MSAAAMYAPPPGPAKRDASQERQRHVRRLEELRNARAPNVGTWLELARYVSPRRSRFFTSEAANAGIKKEQYIINGTATWALRTTAAGIMASSVSPARPWARLTTQDPDLAEVSEVKDWLHIAAERLLDAFAHSNFYTAIHTLFLDLTLFGSSLVVMEADPETMLRCYCLPIGEYFLAQSDRGVVDTMYRLTSFTVSQLVQRFKLENCSPQVRNHYAEKRFDVLVEVVQVIEPRLEYDPAKASPDQMPWASCWYESAGSSDVGFLEEKGYEENPLLAPRWNVTGNDVYGSSPAMEVLGDCKSLQLYEKHKARAVELMVDPPTMGPSGMKRQAVSLLPGARNYTDLPAGGQKLERILEVQAAAVQAIVQESERLEYRIKTGLYADLWMSLTLGQQDPRKTATEVQAIEKEKLLQLGPVSERFEDEVLNVAVERGLNILARAKQIPPIPPQLVGKRLRVLYSSIMSAAQKGLAAGGIQQLYAFAANLAGAGRTDVYDVLDVDVATRAMADALDVAPALTVPADKVQQIRVQRAKAAQVQQQQEQALAASQAAKNLGSANTETNTALGRLVGPAAAVQAGGQP